MTKQVRVRIRVIAQFPPVLLQFYTQPQNTLDFRKLIAVALVILRRRCTAAGCMACRGNTALKAGLNLVEGDIVLDERQPRNSIIGEQYQWPRTVPYYMEDDLEINAKGVILKAFEQYRLKTCINFKPWSGEANYISIFKGGGCFSSVGNRRVGKQRLSIGQNCDRIATIEHEFLHALGFWHEMSRSDRDDYVTIMWDRILEGREHNFNTYNDTTSSALGVPYDYGSMMHYSKTAFSSNRSLPTIVTNIPAFSDVIGQRMEFSDSDLLKLSRLYNCTQASTFLDSCDFERENICGMVQGPGATAQWARVAKATGGPSTDYSNMGKCNGYFMHFATGSASAGAVAVLESRRLYPSRGYQCLQFFYYNSGAPEDTLSVWVREYDHANPDGKLRLIKTIDGPPEAQWQLHHVSLNVTTDKFRVAFRGEKHGAASPPPGGLSLDDINLSETACPEHVWRVKDFNRLMATTPPDTPIYSPPFASREGYRFQMGLYPGGTKDSPAELAAYAHLVALPGDAGQRWPCPWKQMTMMLMDQHPHIQKRMSNQRSFTTDPNATNTEVVSGDGDDLTSVLPLPPKPTGFLWDDPRKVGVEVTAADGTKYFRGPGLGTSVYLTHLRAKSRDFIKGGRRHISPHHGGCAVGDDWWYYGSKCEHSGSSADSLSTILAASLSVLAAMVVVTVVSVLCVKRSMRRKQGNMVDTFNTESRF
ncbi:Meprin A subunit beta [Merluccius polli]|uniref:Metalloendopeptidase n=1 Tax=Merluccius polli TaxID=89951 RepID=A0AA47P3B9_MERPO|nr:Meprin A subunit beta [Merluccius polli]